jgi:hypothetical protein
MCFVQHDDEDDRIIFRFHLSLSISIAQTSMKRRLICYNHHYYINVILYIYIVQQGDRVCAIFGIVSLRNWH